VEDDVDAVEERRQVQLEEAAPHGAEGRLRVEGGQVGLLQPRRVVVAEGIHADHRVPLGDEPLR
jgi:hypothetical protein